MVLTQTEVAEEFPSLRFDVDSSGFADNAESADSTLDPDDTAQDLEAAGRLVGYGSEYRGSLAVFIDFSGPVSLRSQVILFRDSDAASAFHQTGLEDFDRFLGVPLDGITITAVERLEPPYLADSPVLLWIEGGVSALGISATHHLLTWRRGPIVASVEIVGPTGQDQSTATARLAQRMDQRIDGVLSGRITVTPLAVGPTVDETLEQQTIDQGFDLRSMLALDSQLQGFRIVEQGFIRDDGVESQEVV